MIIGKPVFKNFYNSSFQIFTITTNGLVVGSLTSNNILLSATSTFAVTGFDAGQKIGTIINVYWDEINAVPTLEHDTASNQNYFKLLSEVPYVLDTAGEYVSFRFDGTHWREINKYAGNGVQGAQGVAGTQGVPGLPGANGPQGGAGTNGPQGAPGEPGPNSEVAGAQGAGIQGAQGDIGQQGAPGPQGDTGAPANP